MKEISIRDEGPGQVRTAVWMDDDAFSIRQYDFGLPECTDVVVIVTPEDAENLSRHLREWSER